MISINGKISTINNKFSWIEYLPTNVQVSSLKGWFKLDNLNNVVINFQSQSGNVSTTSGSNVVSGSGTAFSSLDIGKRIRIGTEEKWIQSVISNSSITVDENFTTNNTGISYTYGYVSKWKNSVIGMPDFEQIDSTLQPLIKLFNNKITIKLNENRDVELIQTNSIYDFGTNQSMFFNCINIKNFGNSDLFNSGVQELPRITYSPLTNTLTYYSLADNYSNLWAATANISKNMVICCINKGNGLRIINQNNIDVSIIQNAGSPIVDKIFNDYCVIGNLPTGADSSVSFRGYFSEFLMYDSVLNESQRGQLFHYLNTKKY